MKNKLVYAGIALLIVAVTVFISMALIKGKAQPQKDEMKHNQMYVKAEKVKLTEVVSDMTYRGRITAYDNVALSSEVQGVILQGDVRFKTGESFHKGDVMIKIYSEDVKASLKSGKSSFLQTLSQILPDLKVDYSEEYEKWLGFFNAVDIEKPLPKLPAMNSDKEKVFLAANNVLSAYYTLQQQEITLSKYVVKAPFDGVFTEVNKEIGAVASPGTSLATIIRSDKLEVTVPVFPADLKWIKEGEKVTIVDKNGDSKTASISRISDFVDETTQSVNVYLIYSSSKKPGFLHGEYVDVVFNGAKATGFLIPREAVFDGNYVYELTEKQLKKTPVVLIRKLDDSYLISGIDTSQVIVTESLSNISSSTDYLAR